jgi:alpha-L-fucosidase
MYQEGSRVYRYHVEHYGHPSEFGFKDVINEWKAEKWQPDSLVALYKRVGAKYFFAMGNHHDNLDLWNSKYHRWNSVNMGPKQDVLARWEKAARANNLPFGVSIHSSHAWSWYETAQGADKEGPKAGVPYDGKMTLADGTGKWWEGYDPQELYQQSHWVSEGNRMRWDWDRGSSVPTPAYFQDFFDRNLDMISHYNPDLIYYDDTSMPLWPVSDVGLRVVSHFYNKSIQENNGTNEAVVFAKILTERQRSCLVWDVEKGVLDDIQPKPWQTCTCIGNWHYNRAIYDRDGYKSAATVVHMLIDIVSKNGNMLLSVPMRGDGTIDEKEEAILADIAAWMDINGDAIFATRPWTIFGEGPASDKKKPIREQGFNEDRDAPYTTEDIRFVTKGSTLYAHVLAVPADGNIVIKSLATDSELCKGAVKSVSLLGGGTTLAYQQTADGLQVTLPAEGAPNPISLALKIEGVL